VQVPSSRVFPSRATLRPLVATALASLAGAALVALAACAAPSPGDTERDPSAATAASRDGGGDAPASRSSSSGAAPDAGSFTDAAPQASFSYVGDAVLALLAAQDAPGKGHTWSATSGNTLPPDWLAQVPPGRYWHQPLASVPVALDCDPSKDAACNADFLLRACASSADCTQGGTCAPVAATVAHPSDKPSSLCVGHSDALVDQVYRIVAGAQRYVDYTSLVAPDGRFLAALRNALTFLAASGRPVQVRVLVLDQPETDTRAILHALLRDVPAQSSLRVTVGAYRYDVDSWPHAKIVAADGEVAFVGGMNLETGSYLQASPVHDVSLEVHGPAARDAQAFDDDLWDFACHGSTLAGANDWTSYPGDGSDCPPPFGAPAGSSSGPGVHMIGVGRLGPIGIASEASDVGILTMIAAAKRSVYIVQQDLGPMRLGVETNPWPDALFDQVTRAVARGVDVYLVLSNLIPLAGGLVSNEYSNGYTIAETADHIADYARAHAADFAPGTDVAAVLCARLHVAPLRASGDDAWPDGSPPELHAKLVIVDELAFYRGSQNLYVSDLAEYGYIVDDVTATRALLDGYWTPLWAESKRAAFSGSEAKTCGFGG
jgi:phosphatidylserine/phosphatidylglycerophosphate/cardiolipin synthase-like enzyme